MSAVAATMLEPRPLPLLDALPASGREVRLVAYPRGYPREADFALAETPLPQPAEGQFLVRNRYLAVDAYMRERMGTVECGEAPFPLGAAPPGVAVGRVVLSRHRRFQPGDWVVTMTGWREYGLSDGKGILKIDPDRFPLSACLGALGVSGVTAYVGLLEVAQIKAGETVLVSAAAGAVGTIAVQIARMHGCRVLGSTGSDEKAAFLRDELGVHAVVNYKREDLGEALRAACPGGVDVFFDSVGGAQLGTVLQHMRPFGRVALCGMISQYNLEGPAPGVENLFAAVHKRLTLRGFSMSDALMRLPRIASELAAWLRDGRLRNVETCSDGIESVPRAFLGLLRGECVGKSVVRLEVEEV